MDTDLLFVGGLLTAGLAFPAFLTAYVEGRRPKGALLLVLFGGLLVAAAIQQRPGLYAMETVPDVVVRVLALYVF